MDQPAPPPALRVAHPARLRVHLRPVEAARRQRLVIEPLRERVLQPRRQALLAHDLAHHVVLDRRAGRRAGELRASLGGVGGHLRDLLPDGKAGFVDVDGQHPLQRPLDPRRHQVFHPERHQRRVERGEVARHHLAVGPGEQPVALHLGQRRRQRGEDGARLRHPAARFRLVLEAAVVGGEIAGFSQGRSTSRKMPGPTDGYPGNPRQARAGPAAGTAAAAAQPPL